MEIERPEWDQRRQTAGFIRDLFDIGSPPPSDATLPKATDETHAFLIGAVHEASTMVHQLHEHARARAELLDHTLREVDYQISRAALGLDHFKDWGVGYNTGVDMRRAHLERELTQLRRERRLILHRAWQDVRTLRQELREATAHYKTAVSRLQVL